MLLIVKLRMKCNSQKCKFVVFNFLRVGIGQLFSKKYILCVVSDVFLVLLLITSFIRICFFVLTLCAKVFFVLSKELFILMSAFLIQGSFLRNLNKIKTLAYTAKYWQGGKPPHICNNFCSFSVLMLHLTFNWKNLFFYLIILGTIAFALQSWNWIIRFYFCHISLL
jgi:hypothetical protein